MGRAGPFPHERVPSKACKVGEFRADGITAFSRSQPHTPASHRANAAVVGARKNDGLTSADRFDEWVEERFDERFEERVGERECTTVGDEWGTGG